MLQHWEHSGSIAEKVEESNRGKVGGEIHFFGSQLTGYVSFRASLGNLCMNYVDMSADGKWACSMDIQGRISSGHVQDIRDVSSQVGFQISKSPDIHV